MPKRALAKAPVTAQVIETAKAFENRIQEENNAQFQELRDQARATLAAVKGSRAIRSPQDWDAMCQKAKIDYDSGRFLLQRLGAERLLEPELMATLIRLRQEMLTGIQNPTAADTMTADMAIIAYRNALRVQGWIGNLCLAVERELFGQAPLDQFQGHTVGKQLTEQISRLEEVLMPLLERCHRMVAKSITHLETRRCKTGRLPSQLVKRVT
jgi:hypothetical protein